MAVEERLRRFAGAVIDVDISALAVLGNRDLHVGDIAFLPIGARVADMVNRVLVAEMELCGALEDLLRARAEVDIEPEL